MNDPQVGKQAFYHTFNDVVASIVFGIVRLASARITSQTGVVEWIEHNINEQDSQVAHTDDSSLGKHRIKFISDSELDCFRYVSNITQLVYAATLLDTFLSDTMRLLFLQFPNSFPDDKPVTWKQVLDVKSKQDLIVGVVNRRIRDLSHDSFLSRISTLRKLFGLQIELSKSETEHLQDYSNLRNVIVHDQAVFDISLDENGVVTATQKTCPLHPTPVSDENLATATTAFFQTISIIYKSVVKQVCGMKYDEKILQLLNDAYLGTQKPT